MSDTTNNLGSAVDQTPVDVRASAEGYDYGYALRGTIGHNPYTLSQAENALRWANGYRLGVSHRQQDDASADPHWPADYDRQVAS